MKEKSALKSLEEVFDNHEQMDEGELGKTLVVLNEMFKGMRPPEPTLPMTRKIRKKDYFQLILLDLVGEGEVPACGCSALELCVRNREGWQVYVNIPAPKKFLGWKFPVSWKKHCGKRMIRVLHCIIMECEECKAQHLEVRTMYKKTRREHFYKETLIADYCTVCDTLKL